MRKFALIVDDKVWDIKHVSLESDLPSDLRQYQAVIEVTEAYPEVQIGWKFSGTSIINPDPDAAGSMAMSRLKFLERFTDAELGAIEAFASQSNPYAYALRAAIRKQQVAEFIDISLSQTILGVSSLVALGLLTAERASQILNTPLKEDEKYKGLK